MVGNPVSNDISHLSEKWKRQKNTLTSESQGSVNLNLQLICTPKGCNRMYRIITRATQNRGLLSQIGGNSGVIILRKNNYIYQICFHLFKYN